MYKNNGPIVVTIEARMTSSRLPGKVLLPLGGEPALQRLIERVKRSKYIDEVVVATTINKADDPIIVLCDKLNVKYFRGSENDVLSRVLGAANSVKASHIVEITGDCPLIDHRHIEKTIELFDSGNYDYAANDKFPNGFGVQVFQVRVLAEVDKLTNDPIDRVHVSYYIYNHPERYKIFYWSAEGNLCWPDLRVTLDEREDYMLIDKIFEDLFKVNEDFSAEDVVNHLRKNPSLLEINNHIRQKGPQEG